MIPRKDDRALFMRGEYGTKPDGRIRPISAHSTTHLDVPYHFIASREDLSQVLNRPEYTADRPCLARVVWLGGQSDLPSAMVREGITYCEAVSADLLPTEEELRQYEALVVLTGFGAVMAGWKEAQFAPAPDGGYHVPYFTDDAVDRILASGISLVAIDSTTVECQTSIDPLRFGSDVHFRLLGHQPPVLIIEGLNGAGLEQKVGFVPTEGVFQMVPRRVNEKGADAAHGRAFLYFYREDARGQALREFLQAITPEEMYG